MMYNKFELKRGYYYSLLYGMLRVGILWDQHLPDRSIYFCLGIWKPEITITFAWKK